MGYCDKPAPYEWTEEDYNALRSAASELGVKPEDLLLVLYYESGLNPRAVNCWPDGKYPNAIGLNQITKASSNAMKISEAERLSLLGMTASQQLPYVVRSFRAAGPKTTGADVVTLYQINLGPGTVPNEVIYADPSINYKANKGLDVDNDGKITRTDIAAVLAKSAKQSAFQRALKQLGGESPIVPPSAQIQGARPDSNTGLLLAAGIALGLIVVTRVK